MNNKKINEIYEDIAYEVNSIIPDEWDKVYIYAEESEGAETAWIYYIPVDKSSPVNIQPSQEIFNCFERLWHEFKNNNQEVWTNLTFVLDSTGKFKIDFGYEDLSEADTYEIRVIWKYKYLGIKPSPDKARDNKIIDKYIKSLTSE